MATSTAVLLALLVPLVICKVHDGQTRRVDYTHYVEELWNRVNFDIHTHHFTVVELHDFFVFADANSDDTITRHEYVEAVTRDDPDLADFANGLFDTFDANGDGHLNLHDTTNLYNKMDADGDSFITKLEFFTFWTQVLTDLAHTHDNGQLIG